MSLSLHKFSLATEEFLKTSVFLKLKLNQCAWLVPSTSINYVTVKNEKDVCFRIRYLARNGNKKHLF